MIGAFWLSLAPWPCRADGADPGQSIPAPSFDPASNPKLNRYIKSYNFLVGRFGLREMSELYTAQLIAQKTVNDTVNISDGWLEAADDELRQAHDMPGTLTALDDEADQIIPILDRLIERLRGLDAYYRSRGYLADGFVRGKSEDPLVVADFKSGLTEMTRFGALLNTAIDLRDAASLRARKQAGDLVGFYGDLALQKSNTLLSLVRSASDLRSPDLLARGDALVIDIQAALNDEAKHLALTKAAGDVHYSLRNSNYARSAEQLQALIGGYREMKRNGDRKMVDQMLAAYNEAVEEMNIGQ
jgi:hypothetical protein